MHVGIPAVLLLVSLHANAQVYRCDTAGGTIYQSHPCAHASQQREMQDRVTVVPSSPKPRTVAPPSNPGSGRTGLVGNSQKAAEPKQCPGLRARLDRIDSRARQRSTESLTAERRKVRAQLRDLNCSLL